MYRLKIEEVKPCDSVDEIIRKTRPQQSLCCVRPHVLTRNAKWFLKNFPGKVLYSVKSNPDASVISTLYKAGLRHFDVASIWEISHIASMFPDAKLYYMHTVKNREAIRKAYFDYGVRDFSLDTPHELQKIREETKYAKDLNLFVRIAVPNVYSELDLSGKFGVSVKDAVRLIKQTRKFAKNLGVSFHVGSQCMHPSAYYNAVTLVKTMLEKAKVQIETLDVGGGFPSVYPGMIPPTLDRYIEEITAAVKMLPQDKEPGLWCEPGRAMVAESSSLVVKVELRKEQMLYINDGVYGSLFDAGTPNFIYPTRVIRLNGKPSSNLIPFGFYGPTCDSIDKMKGPFYLPEDIDEGDYIEIGQLGAYGRAMQTNFNGFQSDLKVEVSDEPLMSIFNLPEEHHSQIPLSAVA